MTAGHFRARASQMKSCFQTIVKDLAHSNEMAVEKKHE